MTSFTDRIRLCVGVYYLKYCHWELTVLNDIQSLETEKDIFSKNPIRKKERNILKIEFQCILRRFETFFKYLTAKIASSILAVSEISLTLWYDRRYPKSVDVIEPLI